MEQYRRKNKSKNSLWQSKNSYFISGSKATECGQADCAVHYFRVHESYRLLCRLSLKLYNATALFLLQIWAGNHAWLLNASEAYTYIIKWQETAMSDCDM